MIVVLPFCSRDFWLGEKLLEWCIQLDGSVPYECILSYDAQTPSVGMKRLAKQYFAHVSEYEYAPMTSDPTWPAGQNRAFCKALWHVFRLARDPDYPGYTGQQDCWLWWESDAIPLCKGWLDRISDAHKEGGRPFTGYRSPKTGNWNGVSVYPYNAIDYAPNIGNYVRNPWDVMETPNVSRHLSVRNDVFQHCWSGPDGNPPTFPTWADVEKHVDLTCALYHRSKDLSLIARLKERHERGTVSSEQKADGAKHEMAQRPDNVGDAGSNGGIKPDKKPPARRGRQPKFRSKRVLVEPRVPSRPSPFASDDGRWKQDANRAARADVRAKRGRPVNAPKITKQAAFEADPDAIKETETD